MTQRWVLATFRHETNTFSPLPTGRAAFAERQLHWGPDVVKAYAGTRTPMGAYLELAATAGAEVATPVAAEAHPAGKVTRAAFEAIAGAIVDAVTRGADACFLDLHGAMVAEHTDDPDGELLSRLRRLAPGLPILVVLDMHANVTPRMVEHCDAIVGYKTCPHVDLYEVGRLAGSIGVRLLAHEVRPVMALAERPMLPHTLNVDTDEEPMGGLIAQCRALEAAGAALAASVFCGFPLADIAAAGLSAVTVVDGDRNRARALADRLADDAWSKRAKFVARPEPLAQSVARAKTLGAASDGPVLLIDHADNCGSGGTQDVMAVLAEVIAQGLDGVAVATIRDAEAVAKMAAAGVGATVALDLGGKTDMPSIMRQGRPLRVTGTVRLIADGNFTVRGPMFTGLQARMGRTAVLDTGTVEIVVTEGRHEPFDLGCFRSVGIEPTAKRFLLLKSRLHYRAGFRPIAKAIVECDGEGVTTSDYALLGFQKLRRPIYPLDPM